MKDKIDRTVIGAAGGIAGGIALILALQIASLFIKEPYPKLLHVAHMFIPPGQDHTFGGQVIAYIAHFTISSLLGILFANIFRLTGRDWATTKGIIFGAAAWVIIYGITGNLLNLPLRTSIVASFVIIAGHLIFGLATSWGIALLSQKAKL